eukprot:2833823-Prymnesium_polylepis.1
MQALEEVDGAAVVPTILAAIFDELGEAARIWILPDLVLVVLVVGPAKLTGSLEAKLVHLAISVEHEAVGFPSGSHADRDAGEVDLGGHEHVLFVSTEAEAAALPTAK